MTREEVSKRNAELIDAGFFDSEELHKLHLLAFIYDYPRTCPGEDIDRRLKEVYKVIHGQEFTSEKFCAFCERWKKLIEETIFDK